MLFELFQGKTIKGIFTNSFYVVTIVLIPKYDKLCTKKFLKPQTVSLKDVNVKILNKILVNGTQQHIINNDQRMVQYLELY